MQRLSGSRRRAWKSIRLRDLARDVGVNHRAVYRHFPDKLSLLARSRNGLEAPCVADEKSTAGKAPGEPTLIACGVGLFLFARDCPNLFHLMAGERINTEGKFPDLDAAVIDALQIFAVGFAGTGMAPDLVVERTAVYVAGAAGRRHANPARAVAGRRRRKSKAFIADVCRMLIKGIR